MEEHIKRAINEHVAIICNGNEAYDIAFHANLLARFINNAYNLNYPLDSDSYGVLYKECYNSFYNFVAV